MTANLNGIIGLLRSRKAMAATLGTIMALMPILFADPNQDREQKRKMWENFAMTVGGLWGAVIVLNGAEDAMQKYAEGKRSQPSAPQAASVTVQTGASPTNVQQASNTQQAAPPPAPDPAPLPYPEEFASWVAALRNVKPGPLSSAVAPAANAAASPPRTAIRTAPAAAKPAAAQPAAAAPAWKPTIRHPGSHA